MQTESAGGLSHRTARLDLLTSGPIHLDAWADHPPADHHVLSVPSVVEGYIYVGTATWHKADPAVSPGSLHKIELRSGKPRDKWDLPVADATSRPYNGWGSGFAASPAIVDGRVFITTLDARVFCFGAHAIGQGPVWETDLLNPDWQHNQPVDNSAPPVACWTSPLVVDGKVYVGTGLGEPEGGDSSGKRETGPYGFIYCLDAETGDVIWLFCTNQFSPDAPNLPNRIPQSVFTVRSLGKYRRPETPLQPGYIALTDPPARGASVWSSLAYSTYVADGKTLRTVYAGTSNSYSTADSGDPLPGAPYSGGILALDAETGDFRAYYQPSPADNYRPDDSDADVGASPVVFYSAGIPHVALGNKAGSFFVLNGLTLQVVAGPRQLLPRQNGDGFPQTFGDPLDGIDHHKKNGPAENPQGIMGTAAFGIPPGTGTPTLFAPLAGSNYPTSFLRALNATTLLDTWPLVNDPNIPNVMRYADTDPPMYDQQNGRGAVSNPAMVNDLIFIAAATGANKTKRTKSRPFLYALAADTGQLRWQWDKFKHATNPDLQARILGPAISGNFVVVGYDNDLYIFRLLAGWQDWFTVPHGALGAAPGSPVTAVWRPGGSDHLDLFVVGHDGKHIMSNYWEPYSPFWHKWFAVPHGPSPTTGGAPVTAVWRDGGDQHLDLFVVNKNGDVESNYWEHP